MKRLRLAYEKEGIWGLVDQRTTRPGKPAGRVDDRVILAVRQAISEETSRSTGTVARLRRRVDQILAAGHGRSPALPSPATFYRLVNRLAQGQHTLGWARRGSRWRSALTARSGR